MTPLLHLFFEPGESGPQLDPSTNRKMTKFSDNVTASYVPSSFFNEEAPLGSPVEQILWKKKVTPLLLEECKNDIKAHVSYRINLFFYQLLLAYQTDFVFSTHALGAEAQHGKQGKTLSSEGEYACAHSSTLPTLWLKSTTGSKEVAFAKDSFFYETWNATILLPKIVNEIDSLLDEKTFFLPEFPTLRTWAVGWLNACAKGGVDPEQGLKHFVSGFRNAISFQKRREANVQKQVILSIYEEVTTLYQQELNQSQQYVKNLCFPEHQSYGSITELFFRTQFTMHCQLTSEVKAKWPVKVSLILEMPQDNRWSQILAQFQAQMAGSLQQTETKTMKEYKLYALSQPAIRFQVQNYLYDCFQKGNVFSQGELLTGVQLELQKAVKNRFGKNPKKQDVITKMLIFAMLRNLVSPSFQGTYKT